MLLALDIGNTNITVGIIEYGEIHAIHRIESDTSAKIGLSSLDLKLVSEIIISSVVPKQTSDYQNECKNLLEI